MNKVPLTKNDTGLFSVNILGIRLGSIYIMHKLNIALEVIYIIGHTSMASRNKFGSLSYATFN
jgi:hypothetical protein